MSMFDPARNGHARDLRFRKHDLLAGLIAASFIVAVAAFVLFLEGMFTVTVDARSGAGNCGIDAPPPPGATPETYYVRVGYFPLGIDCVWMVGDDEEVVERSSNWTASVTTYGGLLAAVGGTVTGIWAVGARSRLPWPPVEHAPRENAG